LPAGPPSERLDRLAPCGALAVVDLAQIKHVSLHRPPAGYPAPDMNRLADDAGVARMTTSIPQSRCQSPDNVML